MIFTIATRELRSMFLSPLAWTLLAVIQFILAWIFLVLIEEYSQLQSQLLAVEGAPGVTDLVVTPMLRLTAWILLLLTPLLTMRLISEERRNRTFTVLSSAPIGVHEIVLCKYLGVVAFQGITVLLVAAMPLSLLPASPLDPGKLVAGLLGLFLLLGSFSAAGLYISSLSAQPAVAATATFGLLLLLWILDSGATNADTGDTVLTYLSLLRHYAPLLMGLVNSADVAFFTLFSSFFLILTIRRLDNARLSP